MVKNIIILGAGFAGLTTVQNLQSKLPKNYKITLIDENANHLFRADLYEVATAFNKKITNECLTQLKKTVATPITQLISPKVRFFQDKVLKIDPKKRQITLSKNKSLTYHYLVVALGSVTNYFSIPGLEKYSVPLKTIQDAVKINCHLDQIFHDLWRKKQARDIFITVGGGGATGVETAGELVGAIKKLCKKYRFPRDKVHLQIIEGTDALGAFSKPDSKLIEKRLAQKNIKVYLKHFIKKVTKSKIFLEGKTKEINSDFLLWTGGVMVNPVSAKTLGTSETRGAIPTNEFLQHPLHPEIFAAGDNAYFLDPNTKTRLPMLAQIAIDQGRAISSNILSGLKKSTLKPYKPKQPLYILPIAGRYAIGKIGGKIFFGTLMWYLRRLISLKYLLSIMPFTKAIRKWHHGSKIFLEND